MKLKELAILRKVTLSRLRERANHVTARRTMATEAEHPHTCTVARHLRLSGVR